MKLNKWKTTSKNIFSDQKFIFPDQKSIFWIHMYGCIPWYVAATYNGRVYGSWGVGVVLCSNFTHTSGGCFAKKSTFHCLGSIFYSNEKRFSHYFYTPEPWKVEILLIKTMSPFQRPTSSKFFLYVHLIKPKIFPHLCISMLINFCGFFNAYEYFAGVTLLVKTAGRLLHELNSLTWSFSGD